MDFSLPEESKMVQSLARDFVRVQLRPLERDILGRAADLSDARASLPPETEANLIQIAKDAGLWGAGRLRRGPRGRVQAASPRSVRVALRDLERAGSEPMSKEQAASLVEKALHEAFGDVPDEEDGEPARTVRALLDDVRFVRYAPQLGEYKDKVRDLAARSADAVRRWA